VRRRCQGYYIGHRRRHISRPYLPHQTSYSPDYSHHTHADTQHHLTTVSHISLVKTQKHMIPSHDYLTRNTETPVSQALHPITIARKRRCPNTLKIHAITLTISSYKLLSETILGLTETSVSITTPSYIAKNIERNTKHTRKHKSSRTQLTASTQTKKQITHNSPTISQIKMIPLHDYPTRCTETLVSHNNLNDPTTRPTPINSSYTYTFVLPTLSISRTIEPHGVTQLI
jgi:hypothetical protein